jgi:hypothetical protein
MWRMTYSSSVGRVGAKHGIEAAVMQIVDENQMVSV